MNALGREGKAGGGEGVGDQDGGSMRGTAEEKEDEEDEEDEGGGISQGFGGDSISEFWEGNT